MRVEFVGRERELAMLTAALADARAGRPWVVLCNGEPGIGKTRLAEELAARTVGVSVAWGTARDDAGAPPHWPWRQVLRALGRDRDLAVPAAELGIVSDLRPLIPELLPAGGPADDGSAEDRFRLFDAVARLLAALAEARPLLVVIDDAQWADPGSLLLLLHIAHVLDGERLLLVVNHRDTGRLPAVLAGDLLRESRVRPLRVRGLPVPDVARHLGELVGHAVSGSEAARVHSRTGGNPFFVGEVGRLLVDEPDRRGAVPASVREAIGARLGRLDPTTADLLRSAAVVGREFRVTVVAAMVGAPVLDCVDALDAAASEGLVEPLVTPDVHRFVHDLARDAVEAGIGAAERVRLHRRAAAAVEAAAGGRVQPYLSDLARHWAVAAVAGERATAAAWICRAADEAVQRLAYEEAARLYRLVLDVAGGELDDIGRCRTLLFLGAALRHAAEVPGRVEACTEAADIARRLGRADLLAEAAVTLASGDSDVPYELRARDLNEEALAALGPEPTALRARVAANLSDICMYLGDFDAAASAGDTALATAEVCGDPVARVAALRARQLVCSGPDGVAERACLAEEMLALGRATGAPATLRWAHLWQVDIAFQRGDLPAVAGELDALTRCVAAERGPVARWHLLQVRTVLAQAQARFADARRLADEAAAALPPHATGHESAVINRAAVLSVMRLHTGADSDVPDTGDRGVQAGDGSPAGAVIFAIATAHMLATEGKLSQARAAYGELGPPGQWRPSPHVLTVCQAFGVVTAIALGLREDVATLRGLLGRYRGSHLASGAGCVAYNGPVELYLGRAAAYLGELDQAVDDLGTAARACAENGAAGFLVEARFELAAVLARRAGPGDVAAAGALAADVATQARELGMPPWAGRADRLIGQLDEQRSGPLTPREKEVAALVADGLTNREIAARLYLSERTAQNHVQHILTKLGLPNRSQVAVWVRVGDRRG